MSAEEPRPFTLAMVGAGPRGTYALERLSATLDRLGNRRLRLLVFERSGYFGAGEAHSPAQSTTSYMNRTAGQVSFAADESVVDAGPLRPAEHRPTLVEWCRARYLRTGDPDFALSHDDWPKRYMHGLALREMFDAFLADFTAHSQVEDTTLYQKEVVDVVRSGETLLVCTADGDAHPTDHVLMLTGHSPHDPWRDPRSRRLLEFAQRTGSRYVPYVYPLDEMLPAGWPGREAHVAIAGTGMTAIDVVLHLTQGRGGTFLPSPGGGLCYIPSGNEPEVLTAFSGSGLFPFSRPDGLDGQHPLLARHGGLFLTSLAVDRLRLAVGTPALGGRLQLNFNQHVLPLIVLEMAVLHYATLFGTSVGEALAASVAGAYDAFLDGRLPEGAAAGPTELSALLEPEIDAVSAAVAAVVADRCLARSDKDWDAADAAATWARVVFGPGVSVECAATAKSPHLLDTSPELNRFDWDRVIAPVPPGIDSSHGYRDAMIDALRRDLAWSRHGMLANPHKAAAYGVWRDLRGVISYAIDDAGLTPASQCRFLAEGARHHNRIANGAAPEVMERILALIEAGFLDVGTGPTGQVSTDTDRYLVVGPTTGASTRVDVLIDARVHSFDPRLDAAPLFRRMLESGIVRLWCNRAATGETFEPGGLDLTPSFHPFTAEGTIERRITVLGAPTEGGRSFLLSALRPYQNHYVMRDVVAWLDDFWRQVG